MKNTQGSAFFASWAVPAIACALLVGACGGGGSDAASGFEPQSAKVAACSYSHVYVTVESIRVLRDDGVTQTWLDVPLAAPRQIDLLNLGGAGVLQAAGAQALPAGRYTQVRLVLSNAGDSLANSVQPAGGSLAALNVPSGDQSGLKLLGDFNVPSGQLGDVVLQGFDPCAAVIQVGPAASPSYQLKPETTGALKLLPQVPPETAIGAGTVMPLLGGGYLSVTNDLSAGTWVLQRYGTDGQPVGTQTTITAAAGQVSSITALTGGGYAIVWVRNIGLWQGADGFYHSVYQLYSQSFTSTGTPIGSPFAISTTDPGAVSRPAAVPQLAALTNGGFVVVWGLQRTFGSDTFDTSVYAQRFTAEGVPVGAVQQVTTEGTGFLGVTGLVTGGYLVTWGDLSGTQGGARAYGPDGLPLGPAHDAGSSWGDGAGPRGDLEPLSGGGAVMVWAVPHQHLMVQQFAPDGTPLAARVVNDATAVPGFTLSSVGGLPDGGYVVAWVEVGGDLYARRYAADGTPVSEQTRINQVTTNPAEPAVIALTDGRYMISWSGVGTDGVRRTYARVFPV